MDRVMLLDHLALAEQHIAQSECHITRQRMLVSDLEQRGRDTSVACDLLGQFEALLAAHLQHRTRLLKQLNGEAVLRNPFARG